MACPNSGLERMPPQRQPLTIVNRRDKRLPRPTVCPNKAQGKNIEIHRQNKKSNKAEKQKKLSRIEALLENETIRSKYTRDELVAGLEFHDAFERESRAIGDVRSERS